YAAGVLFGRHKLVPTISPGKTWEGLAGSTLACVVVGITGAIVLLDATWWAGAVLGLVITVTATLGDLVESMLKRDLDLKDMGSLLPGHGGVMDRLDALLPSALSAWLMLTILVPPSCSVFRGCRSEGVSRRGRAAKGRLPWRYADAGRTARRGARAGGSRRGR